MAETAAAMGHDYMVLTDHSPRLTVARGLTAERLAEQLDVVAEINARMAPFRLLTGIEVDINEDGSLDQTAEMLGRVDVVVASVHSKLRMPADEMTPRMVAAIANPHADILGHCTGRLITGGRGRRPESTFDAEIVFAACERFGLLWRSTRGPNGRTRRNTLLPLGCNHFLMSTMTRAAEAVRADVLPREPRCRVCQDTLMCAVRSTTSWPGRRITPSGRDRPLGGRPSGMGGQVALGPGYAPRGVAVAHPEHDHQEDPEDGVGPLHLLAQSVGLLGRDEEPADGDQDPPDGLVDEPGQRLLVLALHDVEDHPFVGLLAPSLQPSASVAPTTTADLVRAGASLAAARIRSTSMSSARSSRLAW
jgi:hypothetical protein